MSRVQQLVLGFSATLITAVAYVLLATAPASAAPVTISLNAPGYSAQVCQYQSAYGPIIRAIISKPANTPYTTAHLSSYTGNEGYLWQMTASKMSDAWWGNVVTVLDVPASNWYTISLYERPGPGQPGTREAADSGFLIAAWTPAC